MDRLASSLVDRYGVGASRGQGGMAAVYRASALLHDCDVALKVLRSDLGEALGHDSFLRDIRVAASLTHPHIWQICDSGDAEGTLWFTMQLMTGSRCK